MDHEVLSQFSDPPSKCCNFRSCFEMHAIMVCATELTHTLYTAVHVVPFHAFSVSVTPTLSGCGTPMSQATAVWPKFGSSPFHWSDGYGFVLFSKIHIIGHE